MIRNMVMSVDISSDFVMNTRKKTLHELYAENDLMTPLMYMLMIRRIGNGVLRDACQVLHQGARVLVYWPQAKY